MNNTDQDLVIIREFDAPRELVFKAWTEPERVKQWWGPREFTTPHVTIDLRPGGVSLSCMLSPDGKGYWSKGVYQEIVPNERLVYTDQFADADGNPVPASYYGMSGEWPSELIAMVTFEDVDGKTKLILRHSGIPAGENRDMARQGWSESFDKLDEYLAAETAKMDEAA